MVRVLANGELVQDDDERLPPPISQVLQNQPRTVNSQSPISRDSIATPHQNNWRVRAVSYIYTINQWLSNRGFPTIQLGPHSIEPLVSTGLLASLVLFGNRGFFITGALVVALKYFQFRYQRRNPGPSRGTITRSGEGRPQPVNQQNSYIFSGPGYRLGRS